MLENLFINIFVFIVFVRGFSSIAYKIVGGNINDVFKILLSIGLVSVVGFIDRESKLFY